MPTSTYEYTQNPDFVVMPRGFEGAPIAPDWKFEQILPEITKRGVEYIQEQSKVGQPFFLYLPLTSPHEPVVPSTKFAGKSGIAPIADFVMETDWSVGEILNALEQSGIADNTLVIFTADNGHSHYTGWEELIAAGHLPSGEYRGHKGNIWEGGHRVPFIVKWKDKVEPASSSKQLLCLTDIYSTLHELLANEVPPAMEGEDSFSFLSILQGQDTKSKRENLVSHSVNGEFAYRNKEGWKIVFGLPEKNLKLSRGKPASIALYNLKEDVGETQNVADDHPGVVLTLRNELETIIERGTSREGERQANDVEVKFDTIQNKRWAEE